jgi:hypothetical protein
MYTRCNMFSCLIMVVFLFNTLIYVFLLLCLIYVYVSIVCLCTYCMFMYSYCMFMYLHRASWHSSATLTEDFPCFFISCKGKCQGKTRKDGARPALFQYFCVVLCIVCFVSFYVLSVCKFVLYYCHRVATQLQLTNISYQ